MAPFCLSEILPGDGNYNTNQGCIKAKFMDLFTPLEPAPNDLG
jgi:hypothetical protein